MKKNTKPAPTGGSRSEILERLAALPHDSPEYDDAQRELQQLDLATAPKEAL